MFVCCSNIAKLGLMPPTQFGGCCTSCHEDSDEGYCPAIEVYEDECVEGGKWDKYVGEVCCAVSNALDKADTKREVYRKVYEAEDVTF